MTMPSPTYRLATLPAHTDDCRWCAAIRQQRRQARWRGYVKFGMVASLCAAAMLWALGQLP